MDRAHIDTDEMIEDLEERIRKVYSDANERIYGKWDRYIAEIKPRGDKLYNELQIAIAAGKNEKEIEKLQKAYSAWLSTKTLQEDKFRKMAAETAARITEANKIAVGYVNDKLPECYALNHNFMAVQTKENANDFVFTIYDEQTVRNLLENPDVLTLPYKEIDEEVDERWNVQKINSEVMKSIIAGDSISDLSARLYNVVGSNEAAANRTARTLMTATENQARQDEMEEAQEQGLVLEKQWISIVDSRTRDWHLPSSFKKIRVPVNESFHNGMGEIRFPGDMTADPANVYNCRCTMAQKFVEMVEKAVVLSEKLRDIVGEEHFSDFTEYSKRIPQEDLKVFNQIIEEANFTTDGKGNYYRNDFSEINLDTSEYIDGVTPFHEMTHWLDSNTQEYELATEYEKRVWDFDEDGDVIGSHKEPARYIIKEKASFCEFIAFNYTNYDGTDYENSAMARDMKNIIKLTGISGNFGPNRGDEGISDYKKIKAYLESKGVKTIDTDFSHVSDFISALTYDTNLGSLVTGGHSYDYWTHGDDKKITEITAGYNVLRLIGREDYLEIERELAPELMEMLEKEWNKVWETKKKSLK